MQEGDEHRAYCARVAQRVAEARDRIADARSRGGHGQEVTLIAVTKTHGPEAVEAAFAAGVHDVGENRVQEAEAKRPLTSAPVRWHLIGHLQRNKARNALAFDLIHSLDSERLAVALHEAAAAASTTARVLVQLNVSGEESKFGLAPQTLDRFAEQLHALSSLTVQGVMTMAPFDAEPALLHRIFRATRECAAQLRAAGHDARVISMGMSGDYEIAVEEGATHVRLGTILFGERGT